MRVTPLSEARAVQAAIALEAADHARICGVCHLKGGQLADTCEAGWAIAKRYAAAAAEVRRLTPAADDGQLTLI